MSEGLHKAGCWGGAPDCRTPLWIAWAGLVVLLSAMLMPARCVAQIAPVPEYQLKAAYLCNFAEFITWPESAFTNTTSPLVVGVLGADPFGAYLDEAAKGKTTGSHPLAVRRSRQLADLVDCHILFVSNSEASKLGEVLRTVRERPVLTVSDVPSFLIEGGIIKLSTLEKKVRFEVNLDAAAAANLHFQARLLRLASAVQGEVKPRN